MSPGLLLLARMMARRVESLRRDLLSKPHAMVSDNGSIFASHRTIEMALALGADPSFVRIESPESNGIVEAFGKTFRHD